MLIMFFLSIFWICGTEYLIIACDLYFYQVFTVSDRYPQLICQTHIVYKLYHCDKVAYITLKQVYQKSILLFVCLQPHFPRYISYALTIMKKYIFVAI